MKKKINGKEYLEDYFLLVPLPAAAAAAVTVEALLEITEIEKRDYYHLLGSIRMMKRQ